MTALLIIICLILIAVILVQIGRVNELANAVRGEEEMQERDNGRQSVWMLVFMVGFLLAVIISGYAYRNEYLGFGPNEAASEHGPSIDWLFKITLFFTGIVFIITQVALFYFAYRYKGARGKKAAFIAHDTKLEIIWTAIPAVVMTFLVISGLDTWNEAMGDIDPTEEVIEVEAMGYQFAWGLRHPGADGKLGARDYKMITGSNPFGQDWTDQKNIDDFHPQDLVLPVGKKVRVRITSRDVLHNFYLPQFRVKMDAVPGMPTYFVFTPTKTTEEYRRQLSAYPEFNIPADPADPTGPKRWETFEYELACAELCGKGHYSMRRVVKIVSEGEYEAWLKQQQSYYMSTIRNTDDDPFKGQLMDFEIQERRKAFNDAVNKALTSTEANEKIIRLEYVNFETGSARLTADSRYELDNLADVLNQYASVTIEVAGHTDNTGTPEGNLTLSQERASAVYNYLTGKGISEARMKAAGYGQTRPIDTNDTDAGRAKNRRTEFKILTQ